MRNLTQVTLLVRLLALVAALFSSAGEQLTLATIAGYLIIGGSSFYGVLNTSVFELIRKHPSIAMLDALLIAGIVALSGLDSPLLLAALTTALLLGLWLEPLGGAIIIVCLLSVYAGAAFTLSDGEPRFTSQVTIPFIYLTLWLLGMTVRRSSEAERSAQAALRDAVVSAAENEERARMARHLHDSLAKSLQGITLMATALPAQVEDRPERAAASATELRDLAAATVHQVRDIMTDLRESHSTEPLTSAVATTCLGWATQTGRDPRLNLEPVDLPHAGARFELLAVLDESLDNLHRHAGSCTTWVSLSEAEGRVRLIVRDDGKGFDPADLEDAQRAGHLGVQGMQERLARVGGWCTIESSRGEGTKVTCDVPSLNRIEL